MKKNGFLGIGCINMKNELNYGTLFRTAQQFNVDYIYLIGRRFKKMSSDTGCSYRHIPLFEYESFEDFYIHKPYGCELIGVELNEKAHLIYNFVHPKQACYLLGAEDWGIPNDVLKKCQHIIQLPGEKSLNVSVAGSIVLYDRILKLEQKINK